MIREDLFATIREIPSIDIHSHLSRDQLVAEDLSKVLFYHMMCYPLRSAGAEEEVIWPPGGGPGEFKPYATFCDAWPGMANTGFAWGLRTILRELYGFDEPFTVDSISRLEQTFADHVVRDDWGEQVLKRSGIKRVLSSHLNVEPLGTRPDPGIRFTIERQAPASGSRELSTWGKWIHASAADGTADIKSLDDLQAWYDAFYGERDWSNKRALVSWICGMTDFAPASDATINRLIGQAREGEALSPDEESLLQGAAIRCTCRAIRGKTSRFQICFGVQFFDKGPHPIGRAHPHFASGLGHLLGEFPDIHFNILSGHEPSEPALCSLTQGYDNISLGSFWWEMFYPSNMIRAWDRRLDMVPASRLCAFFSDGYCVDWIYARLQMTKRVLAIVLSDKIDQGFYTLTQAVDVAQQVLMDTPKALFLPDESI
ncbi:MAG: hypothetical protein GVY16_00890 [Planctomycetes bacterium]|jgi:hypothetical protein|nr:hypothetical protein [Planctomycetota bacterium]